MTRDKHTNSDETLERVVLAAEGFGVASSTRSGTDDGDGSASETNDRVDILNDDTKKGKFLSDGGVRCRSGGVAALDWASVALGGGLVGIGAVGRNT